MDGWREIRTHGDPKALGVNLLFKVPGSWVQETTTEPGVVEKVSKTTGDIGATVLIYVRDLGLPPGTKFNRADYDELFSDSGLLSLLISQ